MASRVLDGRAQGVGQAREPADDRRVRLPPPVGPLLFQGLTDGRLQRSQTGGGRPQSRDDRVRGERGRVAGMDARDDRTHEAVEHGVAHPRPHEGRQVRRIAGARPDVAQVGVPSRPLGGGRADEGDDVVGQGVGGDSEDGVADESVQSPSAGRVVG